MPAAVMKEDHANSSMARQPADSFGVFKRQEGQKERKKSLQDHARVWSNLLMPLRFLDGAQGTDHQQKDSENVPDIIATH